MGPSGTINTLNTTRICKGDYFQNAIEISDVVYADKYSGSVIIANGELCDMSHNGTIVLYNLFLS